MAKKKALCVGVNEYPQEGMDLKGCVNDAHAWASLLTEHYDFATSDVEVLLDTEATHRAMTNGLKRLLAGAQRGDVLVFTNSSHGTYLADVDGDEPTYDEALCPYDTQDHPLVDDELRALFAGLPAGARLTVISDSCHSGSVTRALGRPRFMNPRALGRPEISEVRKAKRRKDLHPVSDMREVLLSGCKANQFSMDAAFGSTHQGAFTHHALAAIRDADYRITYASLREEVLARLEEDNFDQEPQLEGNNANLARQIFT